MNSKTPAADIKEKDLAKNASAAAYLLTMVPTPKTILDARYGLGGWAVEVAKLWPEVDLVGFEADLNTFNKATVPDGFRLCGLPTDRTKHDGAPDLLLADFNTVTQKKRGELDEEIERWQRPAYVIFTDVACGKLHLNFRSYQLETPDLADYWNSWDIPGYQIVAWTQKHHAASTALFRRID